MKFKPRIPFLIYAANIVFLIATGLLFQFSNEFLSFHSDVIQTNWEDLDVNSQILYLGMMRTEAAGFLASAIALGFLLCIPFRRHEKWSYWAMSTIGIVEYLPTFFANYHVSKVTLASPPWPLMLFLIFSLVLALSLSLAFHKTVKGANQTS
jgi:hypothetical protein